MTYFEVLNYIIGNDIPSFELVRDVAIAILQKQPNQIQQDAYESLERGTAVLYHGLQMDAYLHAYGRMHQAKLNYAFKHIPETFLVQNEINIIDYGCGLGIGIMCFADFLRKQGFVLKVNTITLIEPSAPTLQRAALHSRFFFPNAKTITVNKGFDQLNNEDFVCEDDVPTLHILSNVLDLDFDLERFSSLIRNCVKGHNQFVCTGPYFNDFEKDERMELFADKLNGNNLVYDSNNELDPNEDWTCAICCFNVGEAIQDEMYNVESITLQPIKNRYLPEKVLLNPIDNYDDFKRQYNQGEKIKFYQNPNGTLESCTVIIKRKIKKRESFFVYQIPISNVCDVNKPVRVDVVSINKETFVFLDNQWEIDMLININPSFEREILVNSSKYYRIADLNAFLKESNDNCLKFSINQFGYYEVNKRLYVQGKEEEVRIFIRPSCNINKPMNISFVETNYNGKLYWAFIDNQKKFSIDYSSVSSQYQQYKVRIGKFFKRKTWYKIGVFEYEDFKRLFNDGEKISWKKTSNNRLVAYADLKAFNSNAFVTLWRNENLFIDQLKTIELLKDTFMGEYIGVLKNTDEIFEL